MRWRGLLPGSILSRQESSAPPLRPFSAVEADWMGAQELRSYHLGIHKIFDRKVNN